MKLYPNAPAYPALYGQTNGADGLTKRELFAAMAMQAFCHPGHNNLSVNISAQAAVEVADALIAELNKEQGE